MKKRVALIFLSSLLSGCFLMPHKMDIEQGNVFTQAEVNRLQLGMSEGQVKDLLGTPVAVNIFSNNRIDYIYTNQPGHQRMTIKRVVCVFENGRLVRIDK